MLPRPSISALVLLVLSSSVCLADDIQFNRDVRPILSNRCFECHGPDSATREAGLRLDQREAAIAAAESGSRAIVPTDPKRSELLRRVMSHDPDERMPPADGPARLSDEQVRVLTKWIEQGAEYQPHWAFVPPKAVVVPAVGSQWARNDIDQFVLARLKSQDRKPAAEASRETLIRRVAFDLTGLPPTIDEIDAFVADRSASAYEKMVDRYLESPAYGEHMARHWLDLARYADSNGYQYDTERQQWVWRDWVIDAYNRNMPFDKFTIEQLAGDLLPNATPQQRLATGFNRNHGVTIEGGVIDEEYRTEYVMDRLVTTGSTWLGLTVGCARCHDHKFDPLSQKEFYQLYAFFNQVPERGLNGFAPQERIPSPLAKSRFEELDEQIARAKKKLSEPANFDRQFAAWTKEVSTATGWETLTPIRATSTGGSTLTKQDDGSLIAGGANPRKDIYDITARTLAAAMTAVRLEALTHPSLPGGGPGRHSNSNFVLTEFEATAVSVAAPTKTQRIKFVRAVADYSQQNYEVAKAIDGNATNNGGWAVDGPSRKKPATAMFVADRPFGFAAGTELRFRLRHEANFATHGIGRPRLSVSTATPETLALKGVPSDIRAAARKPAARRTSAETKLLREYFLTNHNPLDAVKQRIAGLEKQKAEAYPPTMIMRDQPKLRATHVLNRGQYNEPKEAVTAGVPNVFQPMQPDAPRNRLGLAKWLTHPDHPLTARVAVNRYWQRLFGMGLVKTSEDFGVQGELPSHPKLLDWLAREFVRSGWDVKQMQKLIVSSATYRQSSHVGAVAYQNDPENRLLARGPRMRLDGEEVRDGSLAVSGLLLTQVGGRSVYPYQPKGLWMELNNRPGYSKAYPHAKTGDQLYRRSIYTYWKRTVPSPMLKTFDAPEREFCTVRRSRTNTPLQALVLLNGPQFVEAARHLGQRMLDHKGSADDKIAWAFRTVTSRQPTRDEVSVLRETYDAAFRRAKADPTVVTKLLAVGESRSDAQNETELAAFASVARLLMNLNEAIAKG